MVAIVLAAMARVNTHVYGGAMSGLTSQRLSKSRWIRHGLRTLADQGAQGLKVGPMAAGLKVSRGSFYWHFRDISDFRAQLLATWRERTTERVIRDLQADPDEPGRLATLLRRALGVRRPLDRAVRAWAAQDPEVAAEVAAVDTRRVAYIATLLTEAGVPPTRARDRAVFLYWAYLGQPTVMDPAAATLPAEAIAELAALFEAYSQ